jgi:hypothetical protein
MATTLSLRALNRALLARQHLLVRAALTPAKALEHLLGLQAQVPRSPYFALWSRLRDFAPEDLERLIERKRAVRMPLMRGTLHLMSARDALVMRPAVQPVLTRILNTGSPYGRALRGLPPAQVLSLARRAVEARPQTHAQLRAVLRPRFPDHDVDALTYVVHYLLPLVQVPPRGLWHKSGLPTWTTEKAWLGQAHGPALPLDRLVLRYLRAFGPASARDAQAWSGLTGLGPVFEALRPRLRCFRDPDGGELFDLPGAPRPDADTPAPIRFLPDYDNVFLSHADRARIIDAQRAQRFGKFGPSPGVILLDGFIEGTWKLATTGKTATLTVTTFRRPTRQQRAGLEEEGAALLAFAAAGAKPTLRIT